MIAPPGFHQRPRGAHIAMALPLGIEGGRFVGDAHIVGERRHHRLVPDFFYEILQPCLVHVARPYGLRTITPSFITKHMSESAAMSRVGSPREPTRSARKPTRIRPSSLSWRRI